ncbi:MAG: DUF4062 domain-containing protein [Cyclobacteriaceae bacterium]
MEKRYQVFVSSTFADLKDERQKVIQTLMQMDCIPAGMELFPAIDIEQFEFIKEVIDDCDYYLLIIGGRYGSLSEEGISYTEAEYDYAIEKGLKVIALVHKDPDKIPFGKSESDPELRNKLNDFRDKVLTGRLVEFWKSLEELPGKVALSLIKTIKSYPSDGWVRGSELGSTELLTDLNELRKENEKLHNQLNAIVVSSGSRRVDSFHTLRKKARKKIIVTGIGMTSIVQYDLPSLRKQAENVPIDFLMLDPAYIESNKEFNSQLEEFLDISDFSEKVRSSFEKLKDFCTDWNGNKSNRYKVRLRTYDTVPTNSMVIIDPDSEDSELLIEFFLYHSGTHRPRLHVFGKGEGKELFDQILSDHENLWKHSKKIVN